MGIEEGTVAALISRSLEGPGGMDADDDVMGSSYVPPGVSPPCIGGHGPDGGSSGENASYQVRPKLVQWCRCQLAERFGNSFFYGSYHFRTSVVRNAVDASRRRSSASLLTMTTMFFSTRLASTIR